MSDKAIEKPRSVAPGILNLGGRNIECHVLSDGRRVLCTTQFQAALGSFKNAHLGDQIERISAKLDSNSSRLTITVIEFSRPTGGTACGYEAEAILDVCLLYQKALVHGQLHPKQVPIALQACEIVAGCAKVGIVALVDEATGYQAIRNHGELADVYRRFFVEKALSWEMVFSEELSTAMCKLYRKPKERNPRWQAGVNGRIYEIIFGKQMMAELHRRNPLLKGGYRWWKNHQWMNAGVRDTFRHKLEVVLLLANTSSYVPQFWDRMRAAFQNVPLQLEIGS
jgi:hypothetical protein